MTSSISELESILVKFRDDRSWQQFHSPRNLLLALVGEVGELAALLQWETDGNKPSYREDVVKLGRITDELADVASYLILLSHSLEVDLAQAVLDKVEANEKRYPLEKSFGKSAKYSEI